MNSPVILHWRLRSVGRGQRSPAAALVRVSLLALTVSLLAPPASFAAPVYYGFPSPRVSLATNDAPRGSFSINLYRSGDFARQHTPYWCVGASMQMMLNIIGITDDDSRAAQRKYMVLARDLGPSLRRIDHGQVDTGTLRGAGSSGWANALWSLGAGIYREEALDSYQSAVRGAALALRKTNRPVGLIVWRGAHAWVMSGFTATGDPLAEPNYRVTGVYIQDPWYGRVSSIWGVGRKPNTYLSIDELKTALLPRRGGRWHAEQAGKFVLVLPLQPRPHPTYGRRVL